MRPAGERIFSDPFAAMFLTDRLADVLRSPSFREQLFSRWERVTPGVCGAVLVRTRFIDDCLAEAMESGLEQLVVLGAGYDTRALRFPRIADRVSVFEMDHPATQRVKLEKIRQHVGSLPKHVAYIPIRFDSESLAEKLLDRSYDPGARTLFIWEGVTYYIPPAAVDRTLSFIADRSAPGSSVVFDFFPPSVADGSCRRPEAVGLRAGLKQFGEEILFGIAPERAPEFLSARGFSTVKNDTPENYRKSCVPSARRDLTVSKIFHFAHGEVNTGGRGSP
jgi:methyltransferase (TIGR00027 family)